MIRRDRDGLIDRSIIGPIWTFGVRRYWYGEAGSIGICIGVGIGFYQLIMMPLGRRFSGLVDVNDGSVH